VTGDSIQIRPARIEDAGEFLQLVDALARYENMPAPDAEAKARLIEHLFGVRPHYGLLVAEHQGHLIGYAAHFLAYSTFVAKPTFYLEDLFVLPDFRELKVGHRLLLTCARLAVAKNCGRMDFIVLDWNKLALEFYERHGVSVKKEWLLHRLDAAGLQRLAAMPDAPDAHSCSSRT
jgi:GNAT superfamily N-acetyltransferase